MKYEIQQMLKQGKGAIVNTASGLAKVGSNWESPGYAASKHGVAGLTRTAAVEYATSGIRVNAICPGPTRTPMVEPKEPQTEAEIEEGIRLIREMVPMNRVAEPPEIAIAAVWLCSDAASFITGLIMSVDGGWTAH
jgi:NAD(P)-dependent dehydrogenase (short-subunit alcohol dehydrogenase family)